MRTTEEQSLPPSRARGTPCSPKPAGAGSPCWRTAGGVQGAALAAGAGTRGGGLTAGASVAASGARNPPYHGTQHQYHHPKLRIEKYRHPIVPDQQ